MKANNSQSNDDVKPIEMKVRPVAASRTENAERIPPDAGDSAQVEQAGDSAGRAKNIDSWKRRVTAAAVTTAIVFIVGSVGVAIGAVGIGKSFIENSNQDPQPAQITAEIPSSSSQNDSAEEHTEHVWIPVYETVKHAAVTHTVDHPTEYGTETTYHTVCNTCSEIVDGATSEHQAKTGHSAWSTNVPITNEIITSNAWSEVVTDTPAYEELVQTGEKCSLCGETRAVAENSAS